MPMPMLMVEPGSDGDWTHLFRSDPEQPTPPPLAALFETFQADLRAFSAECDAYDTAASERPFPYGSGLHCFNPKYLETSVSV